MSGNICNYEPIINLSLRDLNRRLRFIHQYLCFLSSEGGGGAAADGLSVNPSGEFVLGQTVGEVGNPALLTADREIPTGGFFVSFIDGTGSTEISAGSIFMHTPDNLGSITLNTISGGSINVRDEINNTPTVQLNTDTPSQGVFLANVQGAFTVTNDFSFRFIVDVGSQAVSITGGVLGIQASPDAIVHIGASSGSGGTAPLKLTGGATMVTPETGAFEYDGTNLFFTRIADREVVLTASAATTEALVSDTTLTIDFNGIAYKLLAVAI